jgi:hypothetical protein
MKKLIASVACAAALAVSGSAIAQDKPSVGKYIADGYEIVRAEFGSQFLQFILKKDKTVVWCSVLVQDGKTSSCRTIQ